MEKGEEEHFASLGVAPVIVGAFAVLVYRPTAHPPTHPPAPGPVSHLLFRQSPLPHVEVRELPLGRRAGRVWPQAPAQEDVVEEVLGKVHALDVGLLMVDVCRLSILRVQIRIVR